MNDKQNSTYLAWLNDAHATELGLITMLEKQVEETKDIPEMSSRIKEHLEETKRHAEMVKACVVRLGGSTSTGKDVLSQISSTVSGLGISMMEDALVKNAHSSYAAEHFEIASYNTIKAAAESLEDSETVKVCEEILKDEERMAKWLMTQLPLIVKEHVESL